MWCVQRSSHIKPSTYISLSSKNYRMEPSQGVKSIVVIFSLGLSKKFIQNKVEI